MAVQRDPVDLGSVADHPVYARACKAPATFSSVLWPGLGIFPSPNLVSHEYETPEALASSGHRPLWRSTPQRVPLSWLVLLLPLLLQRERTPMKDQIRAALPLFTVTSAILATVPSQSLPLGVSVQHAAIAAFVGLAAHLFFSFSSAPATAPTKG